MSYSVQVVAAAEFMASFYEKLFAGGTISEAVAEGRWRMHRREAHLSSKGMIEIEDWMVPVHYTRRSIRFEKLISVAEQPLPTIEELLQTADQVGVPNELLNSPIIGRRREFYEIDLALTWQPIIVLHGSIGCGKTAFVRDFAQWWRDTSEIERPTNVLYLDSSSLTGAAALDGAFTMIGRRLVADDYAMRVPDPAKRASVAALAVQRSKTLLVWDGFQNILTHAMDGEDQAINARHREQIINILNSFRGSPTPQSGRLIIVSRTPEMWLGNVRRVQLGNLSEEDAEDMARALLRPYSTARRLLDEGKLKSLMRRLDGHPQAMQLLLPAVEKAAPEEVLKICRGHASMSACETELAQRFGELSVSLRASWSYLHPEIRLPALALSLFDGAVDERILGTFSVDSMVPVRLQGTRTGGWVELLARLTSLGMMAPAGQGMYRYHPALAAFLADEWRREASAEFQEEQTAAEGALLAAYAEFGRWLTEQIGREGATSAALSHLDQQWHGIAHSLGLALERRNFAKAVDLIQPLKVYWKCRELRHEARRWIDRLRHALEEQEHLSTLDLGSDAATLWLVTVYYEAELALEVKDVAAAQVCYGLIHQRLQESRGTDKEPRLAEVTKKLDKLAEVKG